MTAAESRNTPGTPGTNRESTVAPHEFKLLPFAKQLFQRFSRDNVTLLAQAVAYNLIFAIPPLLVLLVMVAALVQHTTGAPVTQTLHNVIATRAPGDAQALLNRLVNDAIAETSGGALSFGLIVAFLLALWGGSGGVGSLFQAFNMAYEVRSQRNIVKTYAIQLGMTLVMTVFIIVSFALFIFGQRIGLWIADRVGLGSAFVFTWNILRWPIAVLLILILLALLYYVGPDVKKSFRWITPGSAVAAVLWVVATLGFKLYLAVSNPGSAYGAAGSVIVLLFFLYITGLIFILGAEIDALLETQVDPATIQDLASHPQKTTTGMNQQACERAAELGQPASGGDQPQAKAAPSHPAGHAKRRGSFAATLLVLAASKVLGRVRRRREKTGS